MNSDGDKNQDKSNYPRSLQTVLNHYFQVLNGEKLSNSKKSSFISADKQETWETMWREHEQIRENYHDLSPFTPEFIPDKPLFSYLDLKIKIAEEIYKNCIFCQRRCEANRWNEQGFCRVQDVRVASEFLHTGEEAVLVPSHTVFFTGCTFQCVYCQNWDISQHPEDGMMLSEERLANIIDRRKSEGSRNVNFVGGDPNPQIHYILKTTGLIKGNIPIIWNSNFYMSMEVMKLLDGVVDLYLADFKYGNDNCAWRLSNVPDYWETVTRNHKLAWESGDIIIRHLVLPNHLECCTKPILEWIYHNLGKEVVLNIMGQYRPVYGACGHEDISRFIHNQEMAEAITYAKNLGFINLI